MSGAVNSARQNKAPDSSATSPLANSAWAKGPPPWLSGRHQPINSAKLGSAGSSVEGKPDLPTKREGMGEEGPQLERPEQKASGKAEAKTKKEPECYAWEEYQRRMAGPPKEFRERKKARQKAKKEAQRKAKEEEEELLHAEARATAGEEAKVKATNTRTETGTETEVQRVSASLQDQVHTQTSLCLEPVLAEGVELAMNNFQSPEVTQEEIVGGISQLVPRKIQKLLGKLTMDKFAPVSDQIISYANKSEQGKDGSTLMQVIKLVLERVEDEAAFSEMYARLCRKMMEQISPNVKDETIRGSDGQPITGSMLFREYLLNRCQEDFERSWSVKEAALTAAKSKADNSKAAEAASEANGEAVLYSKEYYAAAKAKRQGLGLVRFIGELFKLSMLTERIVHDCIKKLLSDVINPGEEEIESLCKLLTAVGQMLDNPKARNHMDIYFERMHKIAEGNNVGARIQFMLLEVIELRARDWQVGLAAPQPPSQRKNKHKIIGQSGGYRWDKYHNTAEPDGRNINSGATPTPARTEALQVDLSSADALRKVKGGVRVGASEHHPRDRFFKEYEVVRHSEPDEWNCIGRLRSTSVGSVELTFKKESVPTPPSATAHSKLADANSTKLVFDTSSALTSTPAPKKSKKFNVHALFQRPATTPTATWCYSQFMDPNSPTQFPRSPQISHPSLGPMPTNSAGPCLVGSPRVDGAPLYSGPHHPHEAHQMPPPGWNPYYYPPQGYDPYSVYQQRQQHLQRTEHPYPPQMRAPSTPPSPHTEPAQLRPPSTPPVSASFDGHKPVLNPLPPIITQTVQAPPSPSLNVTGAAPSPSASMRPLVQISARNAGASAFDGQVPPSPKATIPAVVTCTEPIVAAQVETEAQKAERLAKEKEGKQRKEQVAREAKEKAERKAKEKEEAERKEREEAERKIREEEERKAREEEERKAKEEAERKAKEEEERRLKEEEERKAREAEEAEEARLKAEADAKAKAEEEARLREQAERKAEEECARKAKEDEQARLVAEVEAKAKANTLQEAEAHDTSSPLASPQHTNNLLRSVIPNCPFLPSLIGDPNSNSNANAIPNQLGPQSLPSLNGVGPQQHERDTSYPSVTHDGDHQSIGPSGLGNASLGDQEAPTAKSACPSETEGRIPPAANPLELIAPLKTSENRWVGGSMQRTQQKIQELLNKLTVHNFDSISHRIIQYADRSEQVNDGSMLMQVTKLVFASARDGPMYAGMYARLCHKMAERLSPSIQDETTQGWDEQVMVGGMLFRKYLFGLCQVEFQRGWSLKGTGLAAESRAKRQGLGLVRFMGELFRLQMLTERIVRECVKKLLSNVVNPKEEDIESLCELLTTAGRALDNSKVSSHMDACYEQMRDMEGRSDLSWRIRFMLLGVIELRARRWQARPPRNSTPGPSRDSGQASFVGQ